jgi:hypothetical protein
MLLRNGKFLAEQTCADVEKNITAVEEPNVCKFDKITNFCDYFRSYYNYPFISYNSISIKSKHPRVIMGVNPPDIQKLYPKVNPCPPLNENECTPEGYARQCGKIYGRGFYWKLIPKMGKEPHYIKRYFMAYDDNFAKIDREYIDIYDENGLLVCIPYYPDGLSKPGYYWEYCYKKDYNQHDKWFEQKPIK